MKKLFLLIILTVSTSGFSMELGSITMGGNGCFGSGKLILVNQESGRYALPVRAKINKLNGPSFDRKTCNLRLPVSLGANEKLQITDLSQVVRVVGYKNAEIKTNLAVGFAGQSLIPLTYETKLTGEDSTIIENVKSGGVIAESGCGKDAMLTGNLSLLISGSSAQAFVSTGTALMTLKIVSCNPN
jgi:hypothetical protein